LTAAASPDVVELVATMMRNFRPTGVRPSVTALGAADLRDVLTTIAVPTLLIYGDADVRSPADIVGRDMHTRIPGSTLVVSPDAPHMVNLEQPKALNTAIRRFACEDLTDPLRKSRPECAVAAVTCIRRFSMSPIRRARRPVGLEHSRGARRRECQTRRRPDGARRSPQLRRARLRRWRMDRKGNPRAEGAWVTARPRPTPLPRTRPRRVARTA